MDRRAILQIGTEKTGSTTLQSFLATNRGRLRANGYLYPVFCGHSNHTGLAAYAMAPGKCDGIRAPFGYRSEADVEPMRVRLREAAEQELQGEATAIFCSEHCHSRLDTADEVAVLRDFLGGFFADVQVSVYLRRQDELALSLYSTRLKSGGTDRSILPRTGPDDPYFNYDRFLGLWETSFGRENVHVRLFDRAELVGGDVVRDFVAAWDLAGPEPYVPVPNQNESLNALAQEFLRQVNPRLEPVGDLPIDEVRGPLAARLAKLLPGRGARPSRGEAEAFYTMYRPSNETLRQRHLPGRARLFDEDFSAYPDVADTMDFAIGDLAGVAAMLQTAATREARRLEAEIAIRDARLHWLRQEPAAAELAIGRALAWSPSHPDAFRALAENLLRQGRLDEALAAAGCAVEHRPESHEFWHFLGILRRRSGDLDGAAEAQRQALARAPDHAGAQAELAQINSRQKGPQSAAFPLPANEAEGCRKPRSA